MRATTRLISLGGPLAALCISIPVTTAHPAPATVQPVSVQSAPADVETASIHFAIREARIPSTDPPSTVAPRPAARPQEPRSRPAATPASYTRNYVRNSVTKPVSYGSVWGCIGQHESGNNPTENTGNGYYGMYQFTASTWQSMMARIYGPPTKTFTPPYYDSPYAAAAPASVQLQAAEELQRVAGWGQWPVTSRECGV